MDRSTARALGAINRGFYREHAEAFHAARQSPWPGWTELLALLRERDALRALDVLDVGCGNARFGAFLAAEGSPARRYVGVDASPALLVHARARALPGASYAELDLLAGDPGAILPTGPFGLVALFGVLHHVPGSERRLALVEALVRRADPRGLVVLSVWQNAAGEGLRGLVPWEEWNRSAREPIDPAQLEAGDCLLAWGGDRAVVRYCHFADDAELAGLLGSLGARVIASWRADGRADCQNRYLALEPR